MEILTLLPLIFKWVVIFSTTMQAMTLFGMLSDSLVVFGSAFVTTNNFTNYGNITADTFSLSVAGDFDYTNGNIDATTLNLQVGGDFSYDDANNDFVWNAQNNLVVLGSAFVTADDFSNYGAINVVNDFNVTAGRLC